MHLAQMPKMVYHTREVHRAESRGRENELEKLDKAWGLSGNALKIIAMITMTIDHVGMLLFPRNILFRMIGRLAMPIFAYMIGEGCRYTHDRKRYLLRLLGLGVLCQVVYWVALHSLYMCILITFSLSVVLTCAIDWARKRKDLWGLLGVCAAFAAVYFLCETLPLRIPGTDFDVDYGFYGALLPVLVYVGKPPMLWFALGTVLVSAKCGGIQWLCLGALPLVLLYSGKRGKWRMGWVFYLYYPLHLVVIHALEYFLSIYR